MKVLSLDECKDVINRHNGGQPPWAICAELKISSGHLKAIRHCKRYHHPLTDYLFIFEKLNSEKAIQETPCAWDIRLSMKLARLPMSKWAEAL
jgi:hypothetical protein